MNQKNSVVNEKGASIKTEYLLKGKDNRTDWRWETKKY